MTTAPTTHAVETGRKDAPPAGSRHDLVLRAARAVTPTGERAVEVGVTDGRIVAVVPLGTGLTGDEVHELAADEVLLPGLVDSHVHVNEPGRTEWEGFATATRAAAAGGVTTIVDMPLNSLPPTTTVANLETKQQRAADQAFVDVGFWGGAVPGNTADLRPLHDAGVFGFKCFLADSGVPEFGHLDDVELRADLAELRTFDGLMIVHAEDPDALSSAPQAPGPRYRTFLDSRPAQAESAAIAQVIEAARATGARAHVLHLSDAGSLPQIAAARADGVRLTVETCPHYLSLDAEHVPDGATAYKCCPPIREQGNQDQLWQGLVDGTIDIVVTDHSPATAELKQPADGDFATAWGGVSSLQLGLAVVWSEARRRGIGIEQVVRWMSAGPAELVGLADKGAIEVGMDADLVVFAPDETFVVDPQRLHHKNPVTPYAGRDLSGVARRTLLRGRPVGDTPAGRLLRQVGADAANDVPRDHPVEA